MALSNDLVRQFAKITNDNNKNTNGESTVYGTTVLYDGTIYVKIDGADSLTLTPVESTASMKPGERVMVQIKNHTATVTGNLSDPSASTGKVEGFQGEVDKVASQITEFEILIAHRVTVEELNAVTATIANLKAITAKFDNMEAINAEIENLYAKYAELEHVKAEDIEALNAIIENLEVEFGKFDNITAEDLEAINAEITNLKSYNADFTYVSADVLSAIKADIKELDAKKINADELDVKYANIDFANITEAAVEKLFADSGIIRDIIVSEGHITGELVGVTIKGDLIEAGTLKADRLVVKGSDGQYYKLNTDFAGMPGVEPVEEDAIHGSVIVANSITAEKIAVDDLVAFDATIGGFQITEDAIYSGVKESIDNTTRGVYLDNTGQVAFGDGNNFLRYFKDQNGNYKLEVRADSIILGGSGKTVEETIEDIDLDVEMGTQNLIRNSTNMIFSSYWFYEPVVEDGENEEGDVGDETEPEEPTDTELNTLEEYNTDAPMGGSGECACFTIVDTTTPFTLKNVIAVGQQYTFSLWVKSDVDGSILVCGDTMPTSTEWNNYTHTFIADKTDLEIYFDTVGTYYIYHPQLERGDIATDWAESPLDTNDKLLIAQDTADNAIAGLTEVQLQLDAIENTISFIIQGLGEGSKLTQTEEGWVFAMGENKEELIKLSALLDELQQSYGGTKSIVEELTERVNANDKIASYVKIDETGEQPVILLGTSVNGEFGEFALRITNTSIQFIRNNDFERPIAWISNQELHIRRAVLEEELAVSGFVLKEHGTRGNVGWIWKGVSS